MDLPAEMKVPIESSDDLAVSVKNLHPLLFKDGDSYCCELGPNPAEGVFGCGKTVRDALVDWDMNLQERIKNADENDEAAAFARQYMNG
ncbi:hypothetical protein A4D02_14080 [Niastella koreensis]|uniref:Uncharacterized protein n=2 Tax=Niastella koreensis TaxID=354356 RepID=G8TRF5_NIAKG|nr:hypothetical protein [Niastella koreensis]AEW01086.1 hypothetical protein Niako_4838 [Niastella koreensis GR20-10]OQP41805.1 hypothetical protein A4D02_14080 [Niastella koreensis]